MLHPVQNALRERCQILHLVHSEQVCLYRLIKCCDKYSVEYNNSSNIFIWLVQTTHETQHRQQQQQQKHRQQQ